MTKNKEKKVFKLKEMLNAIWKIDRKFIFILLLDIIINAASYFPLILFPKYIIDAIVLKESISTVLLLLIQMIVFSLSINIFNIVISNIREHLSLKMGFTLNNDLSQKCLNIDYEVYDNIETLDKRYYAYKVVNDNNFVVLQSCT